MGEVRLPMAEDGQPKPFLAPVTAGTTACHRPDYDSKSPPLTAE